MYREERKGPTFDPVAAKLGLVRGRWLPGAASQMAYLLAQGTSRDAQETARQLGRLPDSRSSFERVGHEVGAMYVGRHAEIDQELIESFILPDAAVGVVVSLDRVSVPLEEPLPGARRQVVVFSKTTQEEAAGGGPKLPHGLLRRRHHRGRGRRCAALDSVRSHASRDRARPRRLIDLFHLLKKLDEAAKSLHGDTGSKPVFRGWKTRLLNAKTAARMILAELECSGDTSAAVHDAMTHLRNNADRMDYATARRQGRPLGSGNVEATCKSLVSLRMKRPGSRWKQDTGEHIIQLRALSLSDRWDAALQLTLRPLQRVVRRTA